MNKIPLSLALSVCLAMGISCQRRTVMTKAPDIKISEQQWKSIVSKKIFFGHQSVGKNIIEGVSGLAAKSGDIKINVMETKDPSEFKKPVFAHYKVGKNKDPKSKCDDFVAILNGGIGNDVDIAFMKFCYIDFSYETDISEVFNYYVSAMEKVRKKYPGVKFMHCTVPLKTTPSDIAASVKRLLGLKWNEANNKRNEFNKLIKGRYEGDIVDIAGYEAMRQDGSEETYADRNNVYLALAKENTYDGGHLNEAGKATVASKMLETIARTGK